MSIYYKDYEQELYNAAHDPSGHTGIIKISSEGYAAATLYWAIKENQALTIHDSINLHLGKEDTLEFQKKMIARINHAMTCSIDELPLYINDTLVGGIVRKRLREGV